MPISLRHLRRFFMPRASARNARSLLLAFAFTLAARRLVLALRSRILQRELQLLDRRLRKDHLLIAQQMIRMHLIARDQLTAFNIPRAEFEIPVPVVRNFYQQHRLFHLQLVKCLAEDLRLRLFHVEGVHDDELAIGELRRQRRTQRAQQFLLGEGVIVGAGLRSMDGTAMAPQRRPDRADTRSPSALLLPKLLAGTGNAPAILGGMRARPLPSAVVPHRFPQQVFVDRAENLIGEIQRADLGAAQVVNINGCHCLLSTAATGFWPAASHELSRYSLLALLGRALGCLQRVDRRRTRKSATLSRWLLRFHDHNISAVRARNAAFHHQQVVVFIDAQHTQVANRYALIAKVPRHPHAFEHARWECRRSDRPGDLEHRTMRLRTAAEMMPLHYARETPAFADADDIHKALAVENVDQDTLADFQAVGLSAFFGLFFDFERNFAEELHRWEIVFGKVALHRLGEFLFFHELDQSDLGRLISVASRGLVLRDHARTGLQHGRRADFALRIEQLRHADLFSENSCYLCHFLLHSQLGESLLAGYCSQLPAVLPSLKADG